MILVTGGCRSGKSLYAQKLAEKSPLAKAYLATCPVIDDEMHDRIRRHQNDRKSQQWKTIEERINLASAIQSASKFPILLIDCLTLWVNNHMYYSNMAGTPIDMDTMRNHCLDVISACKQHDGTCIFVTNEVGLGIVPDDPDTRKFRDLAGITNQTIASVADEVTLVSCGIPLQLKSIKS